MKKLITLMAFALCFGGAAFAANVSKSETKALNAFLSQSAAKGGNNAEALKMIGSDPANCPGVKVENGHVVEIDWRGHELAGDLNLSAFPALTKIDVSDNKIASLTLSDNPALTVVNAGRNRLTQVDITKCPAVTQLRLNRNQLSQIELGATPFCRCSTSQPTQWLNSMSATLSI